MEPTKPLPVAEIPSAENLTPVQAKTALDAIYAAASCDPRHAYVNAHHPQHTAIQKATNALHEVWAKRPDAGQSDTTKACLDALAHVEAKHDKLGEDIAAEIEALHKLGFDGDGPAGDPQSYHLTGLRMQRAHAEGNFDALTPMLEGELKSLRATGETMALFRSFAAADVDPELRADITDRLIRWVHAANVKRYAKPSTEDAQ